MGICGIHPMANLQEMPKIYILEISLEIKDYSRISHEQMS